MIAVDDQSHRVLAAPVSYVEQAMVTLIGDSSHQDSIILGTKLVRKHLGKRRRNRHSLIIIIQKTIRSLRPFQDDIWSLMGIESDETLVEFEAFRLQDAYCYLDSCLANLLDSTPLNLSKRIYAAADTSLHAFPDDQVGTRRRLAIMGTRFETHVDGGFLQQMLIFGLHRRKGINFSMPLATSYMIALADDSSFCTHDDRTHHRIRLRILPTILSQLQAAAHEHFVNLLLRERLSRLRILKRYFILFHNSTFLCFSYSFSIKCRTFALKSNCKAISNRNKQYQDENVSATLAIPHPTL